MHDCPNATLTSLISGLSANLSLEMSNVRQHEITEWAGVPSNPKASQTTDFQENTKPQHMTARRGNR